LFSGTLNLWQLQFADKSKFSQVLSIGHSSRASGHRFRVNDITCHPVLPLLLTTSHHNLPDGTKHPKEDDKLRKELTMQTVSFVLELAILYGLYATKLLDFLSFVSMYVIKPIVVVSEISFTAIDVRVPIWTCK